MKDMSKGDFKLNLPGLNQLMKSPEMQSILTEKGARVMATANSNAQTRDAQYSMDTKTINWIAITTVRADNGAAIHENLENNTLLKALGSGK